MAQDDVSAFIENFVGSAANIYISQEEAKRLAENIKLQKEKFKQLTEKGKQEAKLDLAKFFFKQRRAAKAAKQPLTGQPFKAQKEAEIMDVMLQPIRAKMEKGEPITQEDIDNLYMYRSYQKRETSATGLPGAGGAGVKKKTMSDILATYRKDFVHPDAQEWMDNVSNAVRNNQWNEFMRLGQQIPNIDNVIKQGRAGTSKVVKPQVSSARGFWETIYENILPEEKKVTKPPAAELQSYPTDLPEQVQEAINLRQQGKLDEANALYIKLTTDYGKAVVDSLILKPNAAQ